MIFQSYEEVVAIIEASNAGKSIELTEGIDGSGRTVYFMFTMRDDKVIAMDRFPSESERSAYHKHLLGHGYDAPEATCLTCVKPASKPFCHRSQSGITEGCIDRCHGAALHLLDADYVAWFNRPEAERLRVKMEESRKK